MSIHTYLSQPRVPSSVTSQVNPARWMGLSFAAKRGFGRRCVSLSWALGVAAGSEVACWRPWSRYCRPGVSTRRAGGGPAGGVPALPCAARYSGEAPLCGLPGVWRRDAQVRQCVQVRVSAVEWMSGVECGVARVWSAACGGPAAVAGTVTVRAWRPLEGPERARSGPQCCDGPVSPRTRATQAAGGPAGRSTHTLTRQRTNQLWCCRQPAGPNWGISGCLALCCAVRDVTVCWTVRRAGPGHETGPRLSFQI